MIGITSLLLAGCGGSKNEAKSPGGGDSKDGPAEVDKDAPDMEVTTLNSKGKVSNDSLKGKVVIVDFWATWCGPCKESFPALEEISKQGRAEVVGISVDDSKDGVAEFAKEHGATFAIGWDEGHTIANRWKVGTMPTTYVLDGKGKVRFIHAGYHAGEKDEIKKEIATLSEEGGGAPAGDTKTAKTEEPKPDPKPEPAAAAADGDKPAGGGDGDGDEPTPKPAGKKPGKGKKPAATPGKKPTGKKGGKKPAAQ